MDFNNCNDIFIEGEGNLRKKWWKPAIFLEVLGKESTRGLLCVFNWAVIFVNPPKSLLEAVFSGGWERGSGVQSSLLGEGTGDQVKLVSLGKETFFGVGFGLSRLTSL
jgi:hypothetical protein